MSFEVKQIITQIIAFLIMLWILKKYAWNHLIDLLHDRTRIIQASFADADKKNQEADSLLSQYKGKISKIEDEGKVIIQNAITNAQKVAQELNEEAQHKATALIKRAQEEIVRQQAKAHEELKREIVDLTFSAFEKLVQVKLSKEDREKYGLQLMDQRS